MSLSVLARSAARQQVVLRARALHTTAPVKSAHGEYHHLPFKWPGEKKFAFGAKLTLYLLTGFSIPIIASIYQLKKA